MPCCSVQRGSCKLAATANTLCTVGLLTHRYKPQTTPSKQATTSNTELLPGTEKFGHFQGKYYLAVCFALHIVKYNGFFIDFLKEKLLTLLFLFSSPSAKGV